MWSPSGTPVIAYDDFAKDYAGRISLNVAASRRLRFP
jgi:hypothetical protein